MSFAIKTTTKAEDAVNFIALSISNQLKLDKNVLFFVTGGSSISIAVKISEIIRKSPHRNLTIMLTDERYGPLNHVDSNWNQLLAKGFNLPEARLIPILTGDDPITTTQKFNIILNQELMKNSYNIGLFGIGADGHTAGILPKSGAVNSQDLAYTYKTEKFERITITPKTIMQLDEAVIYAQEKDKWITLSNLEKNIEIFEQPAQVLKRVPLTTMFTDYNPSNRI